MSIDCFISRDHVVVYSYIYLLVPSLWHMLYYVYGVWCTGLSREVLDLLHASKYIVYCLLKITEIEWKTKDGHDH